VQLETGDMLFLYTDGLSETSSGEHEYGADRVVSLVRQQASRPPAELIAACLDDVRIFSKGAPPLDDVTLMAIRRGD